MRMFKTVFGATVFFFVFFVISSYGADIRIGVVDLQKIVELSNAGKKIQKELSKKKKRLEDKLKREGSVIEGLRKNLERQAQVMSREQRGDKEREINIKIYDFKSLEKKAKEELFKLQNEKLDVMRKDIFEIVQKIGKSEGYTLIIDKIGVLYFDQAVDVTDKLLEKYNNRY